MPPHALPPTPKTYAQLRDAVTAVVISGRQAIDRAWIENYHETGRLIHEHVLLFRDRADYGARTFAKFASNTNIIPESNPTDTAEQSHCKACKMHFLDLRDMLPHKILKRRERGASPYFGNTYLPRNSTVVLRIHVTLFLVR